MAIEFFFEGDHFFKKLHEKILLAQKNIDIEIYIFADDDVGQALAELLKNKARAGVQVRILYDAIGSRDTGNYFFESLKEAGCHVKAFHPLFEWGVEFSRRNHRKFVVLDDSEAFLGGYNFANEYSEKYFGKNSWRDTGVYIDQAEVVKELALLFKNTWSGLWKEFAGSLSFSRGHRKKLYRILPNFGLRRFNLIRQEYISAIIHAKKNIWLSQSYFVPDFGLIRALKKAARRGVEVKIITAGVSDIPFVKRCSQGTYQPLLSAGARIFEYQERMMHAKTGVVDHQWWTVGTANMDHLSLFRNLEVNLVSVETQGAAMLTLQFEKDLLSSKEIHLEAWKKRRWSDRLIEQFCLLFRHWL